VGDGRCPKAGGIRSVSRGGAMTPLVGNSKVTLVSQFLRY